jgi:hypothetical protein
VDGSEDDVGGAEGVRREREEDRWLKGHRSVRAGSEVNRWADFEDEGPIGARTRTLKLRAEMFPGRYGDDLTAHPPTPAAWHCGRASLFIFFFFFSKVDK